MLEAARLEAEDQKRDVVVGIVETHGRYDTGSLLIGLELLPRRTVDHRGIKLEEFDLDAALRRQPQLILVDELAHTNAPGSRHLKRWQDVEELLDAGIDVFTTLNVQHLESLNDVVAQITGVIVRETVPDAVFDKAYEVRVVDLPVDELLERLQEGKVYVADQAAARALENFFRRATSSRCASSRCAAPRSASRPRCAATRPRTASRRRGTPASACSSASRRAPLGAARARGAAHGDEPARGAHRLLRRDARVDPHVRRRSRAPRPEHAARRVARRRGGHAARRGRRDETVRYARKRNVTKIVVGKPTHPRWRDVLARVVPRRPRPPEPRDRRLRHLRVAADPRPSSGASTPRSTTYGDAFGLPRGGVDGARRGDRRVVPLRAQAARRRRHGVPARHRARVDALRVRAVARSPPC